MRKVIQISGGVFLCDDGTMWEIIKGGQGRKTWGQIPNVPQPDAIGADVGGLTREDLNRTLKETDEVQSINIKG